MSTETTIEGLRTALIDLYLSGLRMPRHVPGSGGAGTEHHYQLNAASVWAQDRAMKKAAEVLGITDVPSACCVGARSFDEVAAEQGEENARTILQR